MSTRTAGPPADPPNVDAEPHDPDGIAAHRPYYTLARRILRWHRVPPQDIEDVVQETMIAFVRRVPAIEAVAPVRSMSALLARFTADKAADYWREERARDPIVQVEDERTGTPDSQGIPRPDQAGLLKERTRALDLLLDRMEPHLREVFVLIELGEMKVEKVMDALGIPEGTVRSRRDRARKRFEELIGPVRAELAARRRS